MNIKPRLYYLREYLFPLGCASCGEALLNAEESYYGICEGCKLMFDAELKNERRCLVCGKPLVTEKETCLLCREEGGAAKPRYNEKIEKIRSVFPYKGKFKAALGAYKFKKHIAAANFFIHCLNTVLEEIIIDSGGPDGLTEAAWVPVPPRPGKIKKQGWDQIEFLAGRLEKYSSLPVKRCLKRLPLRSQKELNREERGGNLKGRILYVKPPPKTAILFDDVITTGATLNVCAGALLEGGSEKVYAVCLFYD